MMRHVYHDAVVAARVGGFVDRGGGLRVVEVDGYGDWGGAGGLCSGGGEDGAAVRLGPGEEEEHGGRAFCGGGSHGREDAFEIVLWW